MALPLGKKSVVQIERRRDPCRRIVDQAALLEWLVRLRLHDDGSGSIPCLTDVLCAPAGFGDAEPVREAVRVRDRLVHLVPGIAVPSPDEAQRASDVLREAIAWWVERYGKDESGPERQVVNDPLGDLEVADVSGVEAGEQGDATSYPALRTRIATAAWRLDIVAGRRAPFTRARAAERLDVAAVLRRHGRHLVDVKPAAVEAALTRTGFWHVSARRTIHQAARNLESALAELYEFDAHWHVSPGLVPLPAIRLEPDQPTRVRLLLTMVEHQLAWVAPAWDPSETAAALAAASGTLLVRLLQRKGHLVPDAEEVVRAAHVRNRLVRVAPGAPPLRAAEVDAAETVLWRTAYELRRHCYPEHADALSRFEQAPLRTLPASRIAGIVDPQSRLAAWYARIEALALLWEGRHPGAWSVPPPGMRQAPLQILARHPMARGESWPALNDAIRHTSSVLADDNGWLGSTTSVQEFEPPIAVATAALERELGWEEQPVAARARDIVDRLMG